MRVPATLTKVRSTHNNLRTPTIDGWFEKPPTVGEDFEFLAPPLESGSIRMIWTTSVRDVTELALGSVEFKTKNSTYRLDVRKCSST